MSRIWTYFQSTVFMVYYSVNFLNPTNMRRAAQTVSIGSAQIAGRLRGCRALLSIFMLLVPAAAFSQAQAQSTESSAAVSATPVVSASLSADVLELRRAGNAALYNIDYTTARSKFEEIKKLQPQHPAGDIYLATVIWLEHLNKSRRLQTSLYRDESSFYAGAEKAKEENEGDEVDATVDRAFRDRMAQAKTKALALVARNKNDADAQYFLGAYYGVMAAYEASVTRKFFAAMRNGSRGVDAHEKVLKLKPDYYDAYLSVGMYDYIVGNLPFVYKALATIAGVRGSLDNLIHCKNSILD